MFDFREILYSEFFIFPTWVSGEKNESKCPGNEVDFRSLW